VQKHALAGLADLRDDDRGAASRRPPRGLPHDSRGAELNEVSQRFHRGLPPGCRVVGRCQVDGMPHEPRCGLAEQTRSERPASRRHVPARANTNCTGQVVRDGTGRQSPGEGIHLDTEVLAVRVRHCNMPCTVVDLISTNGLTEATAWPS